MRKFVFLIVLVTILSMGCGSKQNHDIIKNNELQIVGETKLSELYHWDDAMIKVIDNFPRFQIGLVVQNEKYVFFPKDGNKIMRIDKNNKKVKTIYEFEASRDEEAGVHLCLDDNKIFFEYEGDILSSDFEGKNLVRIITCRELEKSVSKILNDKIEDYRDISSLRFYKNNLFIFYGMNILKLNLDTNKITLMAKKAKGACFCNNAVYYLSGSFAIYKVDISTLKRKRVRGSGKAVCIEKAAHGVKRYYAVMAVDNQLYYVAKPYEKDISEGLSIYRYSKDGKDMEIYEYPVELWSIRGIIATSTKVSCQYISDNINSKMGLIVYDIKSAVSSEVKEVPDDFWTVDFLAGDMVFYIKQNSHEVYLSYLICE